MEFGERKRRRKSQSFKLVTDEDFDSTYLVNSSCTDASGESKDAAVPDVWLGEEGVEIKRQITGMMRFLSDKPGRVHQRVGAEGENLKKEPQDEHLSWAHHPTALPLVSEDHQDNILGSTGDPGPSLSTTSTNKGQGYGQYSTRSKTLRVQNSSKDVVKMNEYNDVVPPAVLETPCCMCSCKGTLQAILQELRAMRRLMQTQKASLQRQDQSAPPCPPLHGAGAGACPAPRRRTRKRRPVYKVGPLSAPSRRATIPPLPPSSVMTPPPESGRREEKERERVSSTPNPVSSEIYALPAQNNPLVVNDAHIPLFSQPRGLQSIESEVQLAEDYDVFIPKAQLDSILVSYTRSGSLLFRKLVCAFFDDATLANSLPNGKRKRGLNDHRKGLDQNIVGAIKVFTEKYCTAHRIEKLPGPRDWVQILQDQIKLARRRLKRDAADVMNGPCTNKPASAVGGLENVTG